MSSRTKAVQSADEVPVLPRISTYWCLDIAMLCSVQYLPGLIHLTIWLFLLDWADEWWITIEVIINGHDRAAAWDVKLVKFVEMSWLPLSA